MTGPSATGRRGPLQRLCGPNSTSMPSGVEKRTVCRRNWHQLMLARAPDLQCNGGSQALFEQKAVGAEAWCNKGPGAKRPRAKWTTTMAADRAQNLQDTFLNH